MDLDNVKQKLMEEKQNKILRTIERLENMKPFENTDWIPEPPVLEKELYDRCVIPNFIRCGAIPTEKLVVGKTYNLIGFSQEKWGRCGYSVETNDMIHSDRDFNRCKESAKDFEIIL